MRRSLRRSCSECAKSKHSCDLGTPRCSRCVKRKARCVYANEPLAALPVVPQARNGASTAIQVDGAAPLVRYQSGPVDAFDSHPPTRLSRDSVQRLIYRFLRKIAFQYYPLDLDPASNPFLVCWWPLALADPALFHVSLQTACLDEELISQNGFQTSELLMADSVALLRRKVDDISLAVQDTTMNSVITLAAIEFGKGNIKIAQMHVDGVKKLVDVRGGINSVMRTSPLTARMVSWVSMLIMGFPQFETQDDFGTGKGIPPTPEWQWDPTDLADELSQPGTLGIDYAVSNVFARLRNIGLRTQRTRLPNIRLHDLTSFVIHRLLPNPLELSSTPPNPITECIRNAIILYMFILNGPTYYSHAVILDTVVKRFVGTLEDLGAISCINNTLGVWFVAIGMVASSDSPQYQWFAEKARGLVEPLGLTGGDDAFSQIKAVVWIDTAQADSVFRPHWDAVCSSSNRYGSPEAERHGPSTLSVPDWARMCTTFRSDR